MNGPVPDGSAAKSDPGLLGALGRIADRSRHGGELGGPVGRRDHEQVGEVDRKEAVGLRGCQFDREIVDLAGRAERRHARGGDADLIGGEMGRVLVQHLAHVPDDGVGVEIGPVMEFHARPQLEGPLVLVGRVHRPRGREAGDQHRRLLGRAQVPMGQRVEHRDAGEAVTLEALVRLAVRAGDVRRRHADAENLFLRDRKRRQRGERQTGCNRGACK